LKAILSDLALSWGPDVLRCDAQRHLDLCDAGAGVLTQPTPALPPYVLPAWTSRQVQDAVSFMGNANRLN